MATSPCIDIDQTPAIVEWQWEGSTRTLATGDPDHDAIRFTLRLDLTEVEDISFAHFEISIPFRFKDKPSGAGVCIRVNPFFVKSFHHSALSNPPDAVKQMFDSTICLDFELDNKVTVLIPSDVKEPVVAARVRSGKVLDSLYELSHVTSLRIYIKESLLSLDKFHAICEAVKRRQIRPSTDPNHDISRMFSDSGGKIATISPPKPPSYDKATKLPPNTNVTESPVKFPAIGGSSSVIPSHLIEDDLWTVVSNRCSVIGSLRRACCTAGRYHSSPHPQNEPATHVK